MSASPLRFTGNVAPNHDAPQHSPRPLPLFLELLRRETAASPARRTAALAGLRAYQRAPRIPRPPIMPVVAQAGRAVLRDYGGVGRPVVFIPSLINPPTIFDLAEDNSLLRWLSTQGAHPLLVDWGAPSPAERMLSLAGHVEQLLLPLLDALGERVALVGYCVGGTMAFAAAALRPVERVVAIAAPWRFAGFPGPARTSLLSLWGQTKPLAERLGLLPMEMLQTAFWQLDPVRTVSKYEKFGRLDPAAPPARAFVVLEDWANAGPPLTHAAARELLEDLFRDDVTGRGHWRVGGITVDPAAFTCPLLDIASTTDHIVPAASASGAGESLSLGLGHVGMVVGGRARRTLWEPLARWLTQNA